MEGQYDSSSDNTSECGSCLQDQSVTENGAADGLKALLAEDPFSNETSKRLFDAMDELRGCGVGRDLDLPQLVIVGKQSAGKSSLLRSLTDVPFVVGDKLCTRFATRIVSRRTLPGTLDETRVSIEEGDVDCFGYPSNENHIRSFNNAQSTHVPHITAESFERITTEASKAMGISSTQNFSSKVLKIELRGPNRPHFGILDLPGIFTTETGTVTPEEMIGVRKMVAAYMQKEQNIIICVAEATDDLANQYIFKMADEHAESSRCVGVFTKCDRIEVPQTIVDIAKSGEGIAKQKLQHGWYVVLNRGPKSPSSFDRQKEEDTTFNKAPWNTIAEGRRGTAMLKRFLANLLCQRIREDFPKTVDTVNEMLRGAKKTLTDLGDPRPGHRDQLAYLIGIAQKFQEIANQALKNPEELAESSMKLRGKTWRANERFANELERSGHAYEFSNLGETVDNSNRHTGHAQNSETELGLEPDSDSDSDSISLAVESPLSEAELYKQIRKHINENKGQELPGMPNPAVIKPLLLMQAAKWREIAKRHLEKLAAKAEKAVIRILVKTCGDLGVRLDTRVALEEVVRGFARGALEIASAKLEAAWNEKTAHIETHNTGFGIRVKEARRLRFNAALQRYKAKHPTVSFILTLVHPEQRDFVIETGPKYEDWTVITSSTIDTLFQEMHASNERYIEDEVHDLLKAYYEVLRQDFITYVDDHIIEPFLQDQKGPVFGLSPKYILGLSEEKIEDLGGEDENTVKERKNVRDKIGRLEEAKKIAATTLRETRMLDLL